MEEIHEKAIVEECKMEAASSISLDLSGIRCCVRRYSKGEIITSPDRPINEILIVLSGLAFIYAIAQDGSVSHIAVVSEGTIIGDVEFIQHGSTPFFVEAKRNITCISIPMSGQRERLEQDPAFLKVLLSSLTEKLSAASLNRTDERPLEERVISYIAEECENRTLSGIEKATYHLHCSRRQLHRILAGLCSKGLIERISKGKYRMFS